MGRTLGVAAVVSMLRHQLEAADNVPGKIKHSVCKWCYKDIPLETMCQAAKRS